LRRIEGKWQKKWSQSRVFEADPNPNKPKFFLTVPYPYTSGPLHIGHGRTNTVGDVYARYKRMRGYNVLWPMAFHISGTPTAAISRRIQMNDPETRELYGDYIRLYVKGEKGTQRILKSFENPKNVAGFFSKVISQDFKALGYSIDWRRRFTTGDSHYQAFVSWQFSQLQERGLIARGSHPVLFCLSDQNAVGEDDIQDGDKLNAKVVEHAGFRFPFENSFIVASTQNPKDITNATSVFINPDKTYVKANVDDEQWITSEKAAEKLAFQDHSVKIQEEFEGKTLAGKTCKNPVDNTDVPILFSNTVDDDNATGITFAVNKQKTGNPEQNAEKHITIYETNVKPILCRCGGRVIASVIKDQWFIDYGKPEWKNKAYEALSRLSIQPEKYRKLFEDTFAWLNKRPCARRRGLGTPLPFDPEWIIESLSDSTIYMAFYTIAHHIKHNNIQPRQLTHEFFDYVLLGRRKIKKVSEQTGIKPDLIERMREEFLYWYPVDLRHTAVMHITNHLSFFVFHHAAVFPKKHWPKRISLNEPLIREGEIMSKSKGNVLPLVDIPRRYSADLYRLYITYAADSTSTVDWREKEFTSITRQVERFWTLANQIAKRKDEAPKRTTQLSHLSKWLLSRVNSNVQLATHHIESHRLRDYVQVAFFDTLRAITTYRKWTQKISSREKGFVLKEALRKWVPLLAPVTPHTCEEIWHRMGNDGFVSIVDWPKPERQHVNKKIEAGLETTMRTVADIKKVLRFVTNKEPTKVYVYTQRADYTALTRFSSVIETETSLKVSVEPFDQPTHDPMNKARLALRGKPALYIE